MQEQNFAVRRAHALEAPPPLVIDADRALGVGHAHTDLVAAQQQPQNFAVDAYVPGQRRGLSDGCKKGLRHATSLLVGSGLTALTTYFLVKSVQSHIRSASVSSDPAVWQNKVRQDYTDCYDGCNDCSDTSFAYKACMRTAKIAVAGINCDGAAMWNWAQRVPDACVQAQAVVYKAQALAHAKQNERDKLALIILTVAAGVVGYLATYAVIGCLGSRMGSAAGVQNPQANNPQEEA